MTGDPAIKLFGRTIPLQDSPALAADPEDTSAADGEADKAVNKGVEDKEDNHMMSDAHEESENTNKDSSSGLNCIKDGETVIMGNDNGSGDSNGEPLITGNDNGLTYSNDNHGKNGNDGTKQDKLLKKPDKILPCPRCNSMETKFCYYNNYNINQPRYFCKNCQRYWTAGGTMRNVPVGAGRRKSKSSSGQYRHIMMPPDGLVAALPGGPVSAINHEIPPCPPSIPIKPTGNNETELNFRNEVPLCESVASVLNIEERKQAPNGENREEQSCSSSITASHRLSNGCFENNKPNENGGETIHGIGSATPGPQCYVGDPGGPLLYPWNLGWSNLATVMSGGVSREPVQGSQFSSNLPLSWVHPQMIASPGFCPTAIPFAVVPPSFWGCAPSWPSALWNAPWINSSGCVSPASSVNNSSCSESGSPTLGKHSRDSSVPGEEKEKSLWVPKTLRIDDPDEAAKSSIWATLGIKPCDRSTFKPFQSKPEVNTQSKDAAQLLQANPAALSRSQTFQESS